MLWQTRLDPWSESTSLGDSARLATDDDVIVDEQSVDENKLDEEDDDEDEGFEDEEEEEEEESFDDDGDGDGDEESDFDDEDDDEDGCYVTLGPARANQIRMTRPARCQSFVMGL